MNLSERLEAVLRLVPPGARVLDVGTDHAALPIALLERGVVPWAVGGDLRPGPLAQASANRAATGLSAERLDLRQGSGLSVVRPGEVDVAVLAGMGGLLTIELLGADRAVCQSLQRLILAPNNNVAAVRRWAASQGYGFVAEDLVEEANHFYSIMALAETGGWRPQGALTDVEAELGPLLLRQAHPLLPALAARHLSQAEMALAELVQAGERRHQAAGLRAARRQLAVEERVQTLKEVLTCWPKWPV